MQLIVDNRLITEPIKNILEEVRKETNYTYYKSINVHRGNIIVTCPFHKDGRENNPSCNVLCDNSDPNVPDGWHHCFTCGASFPLEYVIGYCFGKDTAFGKQWLKDKYGETFISYTEYLPEITLDKTDHSHSSHYIDEDILKNYNYYHKYMWERKLDKRVVDKFNIGYDPKRSMITFPVFDRNDNLVMVTGRSVGAKAFYIDKGVDKPVYLLNYVVKNNFDYTIVTEAQLDALTAWGYGFPCVATIGVISNHQMDQLNSSGIHTFITMFDNDDAGKRFTEIFNRKIRKDVFVYNIQMPQSCKDINDMSKEQFDECLHNIGIFKRLNENLDKLV